MAIALASSELMIPTGTLTTVDETYTMPSGVSLSLVFIGSRANVGVTETPSWNGTEDYTLITNVDAGSNNYDTAIALYGLVNPTSGEADLDYTMDSGRQFYHSMLNWSGTINTSVANATNVIEEVNNQGNTNTTVFAEGGTTGRTTVLGAVLGDANSATHSNDASMTELHEGAGSGNSTSHYVCYKIGGAPHAVTITWGSTNENTGIFLELIPSILPMAARHYLS